MEAVGGRVAAVKPQAAFFERHGSAGVAVLEEVVAAGRETGTLVIVDAKRGDIGSTMGAYADAFLRDGSPLAGDALTVSPFLGFGSLDPAVEPALATGRGLFVLVPDLEPRGPRGPARPDARTAVSVAALMAARRRPLNAGRGGPTGLGGARGGRDHRRRRSAAPART